MDFETLVQSTTQLLDNCGGDLTNCATLADVNSFPSSEMMCGRILQGQFERLGRLFPVFIGIIVWDAILKIIALWKAGRNNQL
ncbi:hypothetical protein FACS1894176_10460 [Bacteroidia bacterium]|nr:hypothetical protein FACS1894176_10460 [Bacteroidia bacterium]